MADHGPTTEQLRRDIDKGRAGSKADYPDPAAAPLGTDDEAAGSPPAAAEIAIARKQEVEGAPKTSQQQLDTSAYLYAGIMITIVGTLAAIAIWLSMS